MNNQPLEGGRRRGEPAEPTNEVEVEVEVEEEESESEEEIEIEDEIEELPPHQDQFATGANVNLE